MTTLTQASATEFPEEAAVTPPVTRGPARYDIPEAVHTATAADTATRVRAGEVSAVKVVGESLERIAALNGCLNAFVEVRPEEAMRAAADLDARRARGDDLGPLAGVPVAVKDSMWEAGRITTAGSRALLDFYPGESAVVVERLLSAGAVIVGRTNLPEFCYRGNCSNDLYGTTSNPAGVTYTPGGSSGGSASAVRAGLVPLALGSDGGGSIRIPASFCGVVGFKPTFGHVPRMPGFPGWYTLNHVGPITATVDDAALAYQVMAGPDPRDPVTVPLGHTDPASSIDGRPRDLSGLRVAYSHDLGYVPVDSAVRGAFEGVLARLAAVGVELVEAHPDLPNPIETWNTLAMTDNVASEGELLATGRLSPDTVMLIRAGEAISGPQYAAARNAQGEFAASWGVFMNDFDLILTPMMECVAFPATQLKPASIGGTTVEGVDDDWCHFCYPFNLTGQPALSIPMGTEGRLPMGLQIVGRRGHDSLVLGAAHQWERLVADDPTPARVAPQKPVLSSDDLAALERAIAYGEDRVRIDVTTNVAAGQRITIAGQTLAVRRVWSPSEGVRNVEFELG